MNSRIYAVDDDDAGGTRLVEATSAAQAIRHCSKSRYRVLIAKPKDIVRLMTNGAKVEQAGAENASAHP